MKKLFLLIGATYAFNRDDIDEEFLQTEILSMEFNKKSLHSPAKRRIKSRALA